MIFEEVAVKIPRFSISGLMAVVVLVALNFAAVRAILIVPMFRIMLGELLLCGALPMANVLAVGLIPFFRSRPGPGEARPTRVGFVTFGAAALLLYLVLAFRATGPVHEGIGGWIRGMNLSPGLPAVTAASISRNWPWRRSAAGWGGPIPSM